jgi:hypothetical protein
MSIAGTGMLATVAHKHEPGHLVQLPTCACARRSSDADHVSWLTRGLRALEARP